MPRPQIAVIGLPGLPGALAAAGYDVMAGGVTRAAEVTAAVREASAAGRTYVVIVAGLAETPALAQWVALQLRRNVAVLIARSTQLACDEVPAGARVVELPADVDTIMERFGAPASGPPYGTVVIAADGTVALGPDDDGAEPGPLVPPPSPFETVPPSEDSIEQFGVAPAPPVAVGAPVATGSAAVVGPPVGVPERRPLVPTERGWVAPVKRSDVIPESVETLFRQPAAAAERPVRRAPVVITFSGKGGVGKTSATIALAQRAARRGGLARVLLIDANRGQGDVRKYLRLRAGALPSVYDVAATGDPRRGIVGPTALNAARDPSLAKLAFGVVLAPDDEHADPKLVTASVYRSVVEFAQARFHLVVLDTQIVEASDTSGLIDELVVPLLYEGAIGFAISDTSMAGVQNTLVRMNTLVSKGVSRDHLVIGVNRAAPDSGLDEALMRRRSELLGSWAGMVQIDPRISGAFEQGVIPGDPDTQAIPAWDAMLDAVLHAATGLADFDVQSAQPPARKGGLFRRRRR